MDGKYTHSTLFFFFLVVLFLGSLPQKNFAFEIKAKHITMADGLSNNTVRHLFQDSKGFVWMATANGLNRYDGNNFKQLLPSNENGLSLADRRVVSMNEDKNGFLWIKMSPNAVSCYDLMNDKFVDFTGCGQYRKPYRDWANLGDSTWMWGEAGCRLVICKNRTFSSFEYSKENGKLLSGNVKQVITDGGKAWIMPEKGLYLWEKGRIHCVNSTKSFLAAFLNKNGRWFVSADGIVYLYDNQLKSAGRISGISRESGISGQLHIGDNWYFFTSGGGIVFDTKKRRVYKAPGELNIANARVLGDNIGDYWLYNCTGMLHYVNHATGEVKAFRLMTEDKIQMIDQERYHIIHARNGLVWITTNGCGLYAYDTNNGHLYHYTADDTATSILQANSQLCIMEDHSGNIWLGTWLFGVTQLYISGLNAYETPFSKRVKGHIRMVTRDETGVWMANTEGMLYHADTDISKIDLTVEEGSNIYAVCRDAGGVLWYGSRTKGLRIGDRWYTHHAEQANSLPANAVFDILCDRRGRMWIATLGGGLCLALPDGKGGYVFKSYLNENYGIKQVRCLSMDHHGRIWAGTSAGLAVFDPDRLVSSPKAYAVYSWDNRQLKSNEIRSILCDSKGTMWIAETGSGFAICRPSENLSRLSFTHYGTQDGLSNGMVQGFAEDRMGRMWITTAYGLSCFSPGEKTFRNFRFASSMAGNVYSENCAVTLADGRILFGTNDGIAVLSPGQVSNQGKPVNVVFTDLTVNGVQLNPDDPDYPLKEALPFSKEVNLNYKQNSFIISFSTLEFPISSQTLYSCKLENYEDGWSSPSTLDFASYKNLKPGKYTLHVRATDTEGVWSQKESTIDIIVHPPFYATVWAFITYALLAVGAGYVALRTLRKMDTLRTQVKVEEQLADYKLAFFTNISHEFRTPLTLIKAAMERFHEPELDDEGRKEAVGLMDRSVGRMMRLINELLEFRKAEKGKLSLALEQVDIIALLNGYYKAFTGAAREKRMEYRFQTDEKAFVMPVDCGKMDKIVYNLLSNAFKYTPIGGKITLSVHVDGTSHRLVVKVEDTGVGISKEQQARLFTRFSTGNAARNSVGIGLHLVSELVKVHKGTISYAENEGGGSVFTVKLPTEASVYKQDDFLSENSLLLVQEKGASRRNAADEETGESSTGMAGSGAFTGVQPSEPINDRTLLVIEDDDDVRALLVSELSPYAKVVAKPDGMSGYEYARGNDVDLILCDVMMPGMDGFEVTRRLKNDFQTSHIPVILLTALGTDENRLKGIQCGADSYITKPFSCRLLLTRIFKLIEQREKLKEKFSNDITATRPLINLSSSDKTFADHLRDVIDKHLSNPDFTIDEFAAEMSLGHTILYRKVKGVTGYPPKTYLRIMRMKKAAELLLQPDINVSEVAYSVGLSDPLYFSKCFKQQFGVSPSVYKKNGGVNKDNGKENGGDA